MNTDTNTNINDDTAAYEERVRGILRDPATCAGLARIGEQILGKCGGVSADELVRGFGLEVYEDGQPLTRRLRAFVMTGQVEGGPDWWLWQVPDLVGSEREAAVLWAVCSWQLYEARAIGASSPDLRERVDALFRMLRGAAPRAA